MVKAATARRDRAAIEKDRADILRLAHPERRIADLARLLRRRHEDVAADILRLRRQGHAVPTCVLPAALVSGGALYRHFDAAGQLLYVGASINPYARTSMHSSQSAWFRQVVRIEMEWFADGVSLMCAEKAAIERERPLINRQHNPAREPARRNKSAAS